MNEENTLESGLYEKIMIDYRKISLNDLMKKVLIQLKMVL